jgi:hypothetical protein
MQLAERQITEGESDVVAVLGGDLTNSGARITAKWAL